MMDALDAIIQNAEGPENSVDIQTTLTSVTIQARNFATNRVVPARGQVASQFDLCYLNASDNALSIATSTYSSLAQTSEGIVLLIIVELLIYPRSAMHLLRQDPDQTAILLEMKKDFYLVDKACSGEIDEDEVVDMLETIFAESSAVKQREIHKHVEEFMRVVDKDNSSSVSFSVRRGAGERPQARDGGVHAT
ncbi:hypothetical protein PInf_025065 [Phytophthora infestans]|nr:hypothetical protein PInf_025065 [Phytophthora infestans]